MQPFIRHRGKIALLDRANVDTDQIVPKQFLKSIRRTGFGESLFFDWRYGSDGKPNPEFELNRPAVQGASILVARNNFGCGSSREHAVWAVMQYGFRAVIAPARGSGASRIPAFADIFRNNSLKNGLLAVELSEAEVDELFAAPEGRAGAEATVDLEKRTVTLHGAPERVFRFEMDPAVRKTLLEGLDEIAATLRIGEAISRFEQQHDTQRYDRR